MTAPASAASVANAFFDLQSADQSSFPAIDAMKLQKLLYYAQAWWLAHTGAELFEEDIEAWPWGPVVRDIYLQFKEFGREPIAGKRAMELTKAGESFFDYQFKEPPSVSQDVESFLRSVWDAHKKYTGVQLSNATHADGEPWTIVKQRYGTLDGKPRIPNELMRDAFRNKLVSS